MKSKTAIDLAVELLYENPTFAGKDTGLSFDIFASPRGNAPHAGPRIKVSKLRHDDSFDSEHESFSIAVDDTHDPYVVRGHDTGNAPKSRIEDASDWAKLNKDTIKKYWNGTVDTDGFVNSLVDLKGNPMKPNNDCNNIQKHGDGAFVKVKRSK